MTRGARCRRFVSLAVNIRKASTFSQQAGKAHATLACRQAAELQAASVHTGSAPTKYQWQTYKRSLSPSLSSILEQVLHLPALFSTIVPECSRITLHSRHLLSAFGPQRKLSGKWRHGFQHCFALRAVGSHMQHWHPETRVRNHLSEPPSGTNAKAYSLKRYLTKDNFPSRTSILKQIAGWSACYSTFRCASLGARCASVKQNCCLPVCPASCDPFQPCRQGHPLQHGRREAPRQTAQQRAVTLPVCHSMP